MAGESRGVRGALPAIRDMTGIEEIARQPRAPPAADEPTSGDGGEIVKDPEQVQGIQALEQSKAKGGATDAAAGERQPDQIFPRCRPFAGVLRRPSVHDLL